MAELATISSINTKFKPTSSSDNFSIDGLGNFDYVTKENVKANLSKGFYLNNESSYSDNQLVRLDDIKFGKEYRYDYEFKLGLVGRIQGGYFDSRFLNLYFGSRYQSNLIIPNRSDNAIHTRSISVNLTNPSSRDFYIEMSVGGDGSIDPLDILVGLASISCSITTKTYVGGTEISSVKGNSYIYHGDNLTSYNPTISSGKYKLNDQYNLNVTQSKSLTSTYTNPYRITTVIGDLTRNDLDETLNSDNAEYVKAKLVYSLGTINLDTSDTGTIIRTFKLGSIKLVNNVIFDAYLRLGQS